MTGMMLFRTLLVEIPTRKRYTLSGTNVLAMKPIMRCEQQPQDSVDRRSSFRESHAHSRLSGMPSPLFCWESGDSTNIGLRHMTSMLGYSIAILLENQRLKAFVAEQRVAKGIAFSPKKEERLIIALLFFLFSMIFMTSLVSAAIETQFTLMISEICSLLNLLRQFISEVPTLLTNSPISMPWRAAISAFHFCGSEESLKLKVIAFSLLVEYWAGRMDSKCQTVFLSLSGFLEMRTTLNPKVVSTSQKPRPIPSVAPVTTAQLFSQIGQYFLRSSGMGSICLMKVVISKLSNLITGSARKNAAIFVQSH